MVSTTDFEQNDGLDGLSSEELEEQAFGPDPNRKRARRRRRSRRKAPAPPAPEAAPAVVVTQYCYACGDEVDARAEICPHCGVRQPEVPSLAQRRRRKSKGTATLLALTLGGFGAHRFYLGQWKTGAVMLLFWWTFIPALLGVVDFVRFAYLSDRRFADLYDGGAGRPLLAPPLAPTGVVSGPRAVTARASVSPAASGRHLRAGSGG